MWGFRQQQRELYKRHKMLETKQDANSKLMYHDAYVNDTQTSPLVAIIEIDTSQPISCDNTTATGASAEALFVDGSELLPCGKRFKLLLIFAQQFFFAFLLNKCYEGISI